MCTGVPPHHGWLGSINRTIIYCVLQIEMGNWAKMKMPIPTEGGREPILVSDNGKGTAAFAAVSTLLLAGSSTMLAKEYNASTTSSSSLVVALRTTCFRDLSERPCFCRNNQERPLFTYTKKEHKR